jgi:hypothetical protein
MCSRRWDLPGRDLTGEALRRYRHVTVPLTWPDTVGPMKGQSVEHLVEELLGIPGETAVHRAEISRLAGRRRVLAGQLSEVIGPTLAAKRLGISRQTFWQILNPEKAHEIKRRSTRSRRDGADGAQTS